MALFRDEMFGDQIPVLIRMLAIKMGRKMHVYSDVLVTLAVPANTTLR